MQVFTNAAFRAVDAAMAVVVREDGGRVLFLILEKKSFKSALVAKRQPFIGLLV